MATPAKHALAHGNPSTPVVRLPSSSSPESKTTTPPCSEKERVLYDVDDLKGIGRLCSNTIPPASAVQAMFMYEMQRQTEVERLFHSKMFDLARAQDAADAHYSKIKSLAEQVSKLQTQLQTIDTNSRQANSKARLDAQGTKINEQSARINTFDKYLADVQQRLDDMSTEANLYNSLVNGHTTTLKKLGYSVEDLEAKTKSLKSSDKAVNAQIAAMRTKLPELEQSCQNAFQLLELHGINIAGVHQGIQELKAGIQASGTLQYSNTANTVVMASIDGLSSASKGLQAQVTSLSNKYEASQVEHDTVVDDFARVKVVCAALQASNEKLDKDIDLLFNERDALVKSLEAAYTRIDKLEGLVRALTGQATSPTILTAVSSPHRLPVREASTGKILDLAVPKGSSLVEFRRSSASKENGKAIRSFVPGKPWEGNGDEGGFNGANGVNGAGTENGSSS